MPNILTQDDIEPLGQHEIIIEIQESRSTQKGPSCDTYDVNMCLYMLKRERERERERVNGCNSGDD